MRNRSTTWYTRSLLLLVLTSLPRFEGNAIDNVKKGSIVGGEDTDISEAPHMVAIFHERSLRCGGSIIDKYTILTAAHCLLKPDQISVRYGSSFFNKGGRVCAIESVQMHEKYGRFMHPDYDVGLIRVREPIEFGKNAKPIALPEVTPETGTAVRISGWGDTREYQPISQHLKSTEVDIFDWEKCRQLYKEITSRMICASRPGKDSCQGDSGGGMDFNGTVVGIVSFGYGCADPVYPGVYTNVADPEILDFIKRNLN